jgi:parallel beta-helix repeat protein
VWVWNQGKGTIEGCDIFSNTFAGIWIRDEGDPVVRNCKIYKNGYTAIQIYKGGSGRIEGCDLRGDERGAWDIAADCKVQRSHNIDK